jgi:hypothetical protein
VAWRVRRLTLKGLHPQLSWIRCRWQMRLRLNWGACEVLGQLWPRYRGYLMPLALAQGVSFHDGLMQ